MKNRTPDALPDEARSAEELGRSLPGAIAASARQGDQLAEVLRPQVEKALLISARRAQPAMVEALHHVVWRAMWKAAVEGLRRLLLRFDRCVLVTVAPRGLAWRVEALRLGRPFRDVLREKLNARRVKHVFLIHRETGMLLDSAHQEDLPAMDGDMLSAMLTAIQDFVHDSFASPRGDRLSGIQVGDITVWLEQGRSAILAGVLDGDATDEHRQTFHDALRRIEKDFDGALSLYAGDSSHFAGAHIYLESCVRLRADAEPQRIMRLTWAILGAAALALAFLAVAAIRQRIDWDVYVRQIAAQPGIVVIDSGWRNGRFFVRGLRDPLSLDPVAMLAPMGIDRARVDSAWTDYQAMIPELTLIRARQALNPPDTVTLELHGQTLQARGTATPEWIQDARRMVRMLPGVNFLDLNNVQERDRRDLRLWDIYLGTLRAQPGIVVLEQGEAEGRFFVTGLRDPSAVDPVQLLDDIGLDRGRVQGRWESYPSNVPVFVLARAKSVLTPPPTVTLRMGSNERLILEGEASHSWIRDARLLARTVAGVREIDISALTDRDLNAVNALRSRIEAVSIRFVDRGADLWPGQALNLEELSRLAIQLESVARPLGIDPRIELWAFATDTADGATAAAETSAMANRLMSVLAAQGVDTRLFSIRRGVDGGTHAPSGRPETAKRWISFRVVLPDR